MGRLTDTKQLRIYLENNPGEIFDLSYLSETTFHDIPKDNLRKYLSRLSKEGLITKISKGIYLIGEAKKPLSEAVLKHYTKHDEGILGGESLLYKLGFAYNKPKITTILTNLTKGNKFIQSLNIRLLETKTCFMTYVGSHDLAIAIEIIAHYGSIDEKQQAEVNSKIFEFLRKYTDTRFEKDIEILYKRKVYLLLDKFLQVMGISNRVMDIYEDKIRLRNYK